jgi:hypothetical protein
MATATALLKELTAVARTLTFEPAAPATSARDAGETEREKSAAGATAVTVVVTVAEWLRAPEVPENVTVALPAAADDAAVSVTVCAVPGSKVNVAGLAVTPDGRPVTVTLTVPLKPFCGTAFMLTVWPAPPAVSVTVAGVGVSEKSGVRSEVEWNPPPHDMNAMHVNRDTVEAIVRRRILVSCNRDNLNTLFKEGPIVCFVTSFLICK